NIKMMEVHSIRIRIKCPTLFLGAEGGKRDCLKYGSLECIRLQEAGTTWLTSLYRMRLRIICDDFRAFNIRRRASQYKRLVVDWKYIAACALTVYHEINNPGQNICDTSNYLSKCRNIINTDKTSNIVLGAEGGKRVNYSDLKGLYKFILQFIGYHPHSYDLNASQNIVTDLIRCCSLGMHIIIKPIYLTDALKSLTNFSPKCPPLKKMSLCFCVHEKEKLFIEGPSVQNRWKTTRSQQAKHGTTASTEPQRNNSSIRKSTRQQQPSVCRSKPTDSSTKNSLQSKLTMKGRINSRPLIEIKTAKEKKNQNPNIKEITNRYEQKPLKSWLDQCIQEDIFEELSNQSQ
ncbi:Hypothetical predicted protein, partial [Paramuricea clavata]